MLPAIVFGAYDQRRDQTDVVDVVLSTNTTHRLEPALHIFVTFC